MSTACLQPCSASSLDGYGKSIDATTPPIDYWLREDDDEPQLREAKSLKTNAASAGHEHRGQRANGPRKHAPHADATHAAGADGENGSAPYRPLTMERRATRNLAQEAEKQMQELELLARQLIQQREEQQQSISRELHDNVAQVITAVTNRMSLARTTSKIPAWLRQELCDLQESLNSALSDIRILARELRPSLLDHCGFAATLEKHTADFRERTRMDLELKVAPDAASFLGPTDLTHLFRLVQEAMQNIEEHSGAKRAWLNLVRNNGSLDLEIGDDGVGFDGNRVIDAQSDGHLGLLGMRERAELLGGSFLLESSPGTGTSIRVSVPVPPTREIQPGTHS